MNKGGEFLWCGVTDEGWVRLMTQKLGMSSRAGVAACGAGPSVNLYVLFTFFWILFKSSKKERRGLLDTIIHGFGLVAYWA